MSERAVRIGIGALALVGAGISGYLLQARLSGGQLACTNGGCETAKSSRYSEVVGIPVAALGLGAYLALLASAFVRGPLAVVGGAAIAVSGAAFSGYLLVLQLVVIDTVCEWCVASDVVISLLAALTLVRVSHSVRDGRPTHSRGRRSGEAVARRSGTRKPPAQRRSRAARSPRW